MPAGSRFLLTKGMFGEKLTYKDRGFAGDGNYYCLTIRNHILHSAHPLGWIREFKVLIDGKEVPPAQLFFVLRGQWICAEQMPTITELYWTIDEEAEIYIKTQKELQQGIHDMTVCFSVSGLEGTRVLDMEDRWPRKQEEADFKVQVIKEVV